jgi:tetratricopeptide (TPR) repeat protein
MAADCYYQLHEYHKAMKLLEGISMASELLRCGINRLLEGADIYYYYPRIFYLRGLVHEALNEPEEAVKAYQEFLKIWKNADEDLPELIDAKVRLAKLKSEN